MPGGPANTMNGMADDESRLMDAVRERTVLTETELPPPPPGVRHVRVPVAEVIVIADDTLRKRINRFFHWPMIILALVMLPIIALDLLVLPNHPEMQYGPLWWVCMIAIWVIWAAFLVEFVIKIAVAESRFEYVKRNWLDVIILVVPFMRPLRVWRIAKTARVFTLRGVGMKAARYGFTLIIGLEATDRILTRVGLKDDKDRKDPREMTRLQLIREVRQSRKRLDAWEDWYCEHREFLDEQGHDFHEHLPPLSNDEPAGKTEPDGTRDQAPVIETVQDERDSNTQPDSPTQQPAGGHSA